MQADTPETTDTPDNGTRTGNAKIDPTALIRALADEMPSALLRRALRSLGVDIRAIY